MADHQNKTTAAAQRGKTAATKKGRRGRSGASGKARAQWLGARKGVRPAGIAIIVCVGIVLAAACLLLQESALTHAPSAAGAGIRINEIMSNNVSTLITNEGDVPDWVEIVNTGSESVNIGGYSLVLESKMNKAFVFPAYTLASGECALVYANGMGDGSWSAPYRLSASGGEMLILLDARGTTVDSLELPELEADVSYARNADASWSMERDATPGADNGSNAKSTGDRGVNVVADALELSEVSASNTLYFCDEDGQAYDYVEIHNASENAVELGGWYLSDSSDKLKRWTFPKVSIPANGYLAVHCSGFERVENPNHLHANFKLSAGESVYLSRPDGQCVSCVQPPALLDDQAWSLIDGEWTAELGPTPNLPNTQEAAAQTQRATFGDRSATLCLNEIMASPREQLYDWIELYNGSNQVVDLSGFGLSDDSTKPRKWQFPSGTTIQPGEYKGVYLSGTDAQTLGGFLNADFALSSVGNYTVLLSDPNGKVLDAVYLPSQYGGVSYGRAEGRDGFFYYEAPTPGAANSTNAYRARARMAACSVTGGLFRSGDQFSVTLSAPEGSKIYYTLDCSDPTEASTFYTAPISVSSTTILRTRVYQDGCLPSFADTQSYIYDVQNDSEVYVISLVSDMDNLTGDLGILSNPKEDWEREAHVEMFSAEGECLFGQGCGISIHGGSSRNLPIKTFNVIARSEYGGNRFNYPIFSERDYDSYQSFLLRPSGEDFEMSFMRDSVLSSLMKDSSLMYQKAEIAIVYLDGEYYTLDYIRERINTHSICQFEGWEGMEKQIDYVVGNASVLQGSNKSYVELVEWLKANDPTTDQAYEMIDRYIDIQNYIEYMSIEIFTGNTDLLNVRRYRNGQTDGKWRWVLFDLDWAFFNDNNSIGRWLRPGGAGTSNATDNTLFILCMRNPRFLDAFLTYFGQKMATDFSTENVVARFAERYARIEAVLPQYTQRWNIDLSYGIRKVINYAEERPNKLLNTYFKEALQLTDAQMQKYFGEALEKIRLSADGEE